jgi:hypothetical protein
MQTIKSGGGLVNVGAGTVMMMGGRVYDEFMGTTRMIRICHEFSGVYADRNGAIVKASKVV